MRMRPPVEREESLERRQEAAGGSGRGRRLLAAVAALAAVGLLAWGSCSADALPSDRAAEGLARRGLPVVFEKKERTVREWRPVVAFEGERGARYESVEVWDWGDEDGDVVEICGQRVALRHAPVSVRVDGFPVWVLGVRDGYGGISLGVRLTGTGQVRVMRIPRGYAGRIDLVCR